jgi:hypothetical protein
MRTASRLAAAPALQPIERVMNALQSAGLTPRRSGKGWSVRCPAHHDKSPSLQIVVGREGRVLLRCWAGCQTDDVLVQLGLKWTDLFSHPSYPSPGSRPTSSPRSPSWSAEAARKTWQLALDRARDDGAVEADAEVYGYLAHRGLASSWESSAFGVLHPSLAAALPPQVRLWPQRGYRVLVPLFDLRGELMEVQARTIDRSTRPKTLFPRGGRSSGCCFACSRGREVLKGGGAAAAVLLGEGLTDFLALIITSPVPTLAIPGTSVAAASVGEWARGRRVLLCLDADPAGDRGVKDAARAILRFGGRPFRVRWPEGLKDATDVMKRFGAEGLSQFLDAAMEKAERDPS